MEKPPMEPGYPKLDQHNDLPPPYYPDVNQQQQGQGPPVGFVQQGQGAPGGFVQQGPPMQQNPALVQVVQIMNLGPRSSRMHCPYCGADVETRVKHTPGRMTHIAALIVCLLCWPCVCVPYCIDDCMDAEHDCPNCDRHIGTYKR